MATFLMPVGATVMDDRELMAEVERRHGGAGGIHFYALVTRNTGRHGHAWERIDGVVGAKNECSTRDAQLE